MALGNKSLPQEELFETLISFVGDADGIVTENHKKAIKLTQKEDGKSITINAEDLDDVLLRDDRDGTSFVQVNFRNESKILITKNLIGFKPHTTRGLDLEKVPNVVTTPDIVSVFEAIEESLHDSMLDIDELETLKKVFQSILIGAELIGFDMSNERDWLQRLHLPASIAL